MSGGWAAAPARMGWVLALLENEGEGVTPPGWLGNEEGMEYRDWETDRKSTRLNSSHSRASRMPSSA